MRAIAYMLSRATIKTNRNSVSRCVFARGTSYKLHPDPIWNEGALVFFVKLRMGMAAILKVYYVMSEIRFIW